jgi:hypothetical protein
MAKNITTAATTLEQLIFNGMIPRLFKASTARLNRMEPISEVFFAAVRAASSNPVTTGPYSLINRMKWFAFINVAPNFSKLCRFQLPV